MKIVIIGPGALGSLLAASLARIREHEIWLLDREAERAAYLDSHGITVEEAGRCRTFMLRAAADPAVIGPADVVFLCVKSFAVRQALEASAPVFGPATLLIALQNGIGHLGVLRGRKLKNPWALGVTALGATLVQPGHVKHGGRGLTRLGFVKPPQERAADLLARVAHLLTQAGVEAEVVGNILDHVWAKLLINAGINALTVIHDCPNGELLHIAEAEDSMEQAILEGVRVARAKSVALVGDPVAAAKEVCRATANNISSMLQDVRRQRTTEIEAINGALLAEARKLGIPAPVNEELVRAVKKIEKERAG